MIYAQAINRYLEHTGFRNIDLRAALIDMDGTLYDSMPSHARAWQQMMRELGVEMPYEELFLHEGRTGAATIDLFFTQFFDRHATEQECKDLYRRKTELFAAMPAVDAMPGASRMLQVLEQAGIKRVLVTGSGQSSLLNRLDSDFPGAFSADMRVTSRDVKHGKPNPEPYLKAMQMAACQPWQSIVIENAPLGVEAGHRAEAFTVAVATGPIPLGTLKDAGADVVFASMTEFANALPQLIYEMSTICHRI